MYQSLNGFFLSWEYEVEETMKIFQGLTDDSLHQRVTPEQRNLGEIAFHIINSIQELMEHTGLEIEDSVPEDSVLESSEALIRHYENSCHSFKKAIYTQWTDHSLNENSTLYGKVLPNHFFLMTLIRHQIHHRGQITVLMRQAGLKVPGIYGPSKEEEAARELKKT